MSWLLLKTKQKELQGRGMISCRNRGQDKVQPDIYISENSHKTFQLNGPQKIQCVHVCACVFVLAYKTTGNYAGVSFTYLHVHHWTQQENVETVLYILYVKIHL